MSINLDDLIEGGEVWAEIMLKAGKQVPPTLFITTPDNDIHFIVYGDGIHNQGDKARMVAANKLICASMGATAAVMVLEAWFIVRQPGQQDDVPSEQMDRKELVMFLGESVDGNKRVQREIIRSGNGNFFNLADKAEMPQFEGIFANFFPGKLPPEVVIAAKEVLNRSGIRLERFDPRAREFKPR